MTIEEMLEQMAGGPTVEVPLPGNSHWLDEKGKHGLSEYFWKSKYPCILEATGYTPEQIKNLCENFSE